MLNTLAIRTRETQLFLPYAVGPMAVKRGSFTVLFCRDSDILFINEQKVEKKILDPEVLSSKFYHKKMWS